MYAKSLLYLIMASQSLSCLECPVYAASDRVPLHVPYVIRVESGVETPLPILITSNSEAIQKAMILIRGLPSDVSLTQGRLFPSGVWAVKASAYRTVRVVSNSDAEEEVDLIFSLVTLEGTSLGNVATRLLVARQRTPGESPPAAVAAAPPDVAALPKEEIAASTVSTVSKGEIEAPAPNAVSLTDLPANGASRLPGDAVERILKFMERGDQHLLEGKIASARRFYQRAAESGWPDAANAIARTYDVNHLSRFPILGGIEPNEALAQEWYGKARELNAKLQIQGPRRTGQQ
jgi:hypothetical protein